MGRKSETSALSALSALERGEVLSSLLRAHPSLVAEAERVAAGLLGGADGERVAGDVAGALRALHLRDLAERAGPQGGEGSVDPEEAADELLSEVVEPYLDDLDRRARRQARAAATEIGLGLLLGLYSCRDEDDAERVLTHAGMPDSVDHLAIQVISTMARHGLELPEGWLAEECPGWPESWLVRPTPG